ncbi:MAG: hypothetical protein KF819_26460 [Labilithrix sp.]|nr:hypothetical protein [Labilithrix sp.]
MVVLGRRTFAVGAALAACTSSPVRGAPTFAASASAARDHWTARFFGRPPVAMLATRFVAPKPRELSPLFVRWQGPGLQTDPPSFERQVMPFGYSALMKSPDGELFMDADGATLAVLRGVPVGADPFVLRCFQQDGDLCGRRLPDFRLVGTSSSGVMQAKTARDTLLFRLPDGTTWVTASGLVALRVADALAKDPSVPPSERFEPSATVAQLVIADGGNASVQAQMLGGADLQAIASLAYPAPPGGPAPVALRFYFRADAAARVAAEDLERRFAHARATKEHRWEQFPVSSAVAIEGATVIVRGTMPFDTIASWSA